MTSTINDNFYNVNEKEYKRRINAWTMYDWANSAFATTILAAVLPVYYSQVAGATLPSEATATAYWSIGLSVSLLINAIIDPILGTVSDVMRGKKRFLAFFMGIGVIGTGLLVLVSTGDWFLASLLFLLGRIGFTGSIVFYDALLPHIARDADRDNVSARGYAMGYLGGGLLLAINVVMIFLLPGTWGPRLSFVSVAIWWALFSIPVLRRVPEPPSAMAILAAGETVISATFKRLRDTLHDLRRYRELVKYLVSFLIYNDGIGTIIGVAAIYGAELGFGSVELILALLLVQFVGIPFSLIFGSLPQAKQKRRPQYLAFVVFNIVCLPLLGILGLRLLPVNITGAPPPAYQNTNTALGEGIYPATHEALTYAGKWTGITGPEGAIYQTSNQAADQIDMRFNGQQVDVTYLAGPEQGIWGVEIDGQPLLDKDTGQPLAIDTYKPTIRYGVRQTITAIQPGEHILTLVNTGKANAKSDATKVSFTQVEVLAPIRQSNLGIILGLILALQAVGVVFAWLAGKALFTDLANSLDTKRSIILALIIYSIVAVWGFFLNSTMEFWSLAWMVAIVQGGSQALSRSLYAHMSPAAKSGEFFGLFSVMEKFSSLIGPLLFAGAALIFGSSRPAILSLIALFIIGIYILNKVNVTEGRRVAVEEDAA